MSDCTTTIGFIPKEDRGFLVCEYSECLEIATMTITVYDEEPYNDSEYFCSRHAYSTYLSYTEDYNLKIYMQVYADKRENTDITRCYTCNRNLKDLKTITANKSIVTEDTKDVKLYCNYICQGDMIS